MKKFTYLIVLVLIVSFPKGSVFAQKTLPQVPITYQGDTNDTIMRRAKWVEDAKKEGKLVWWGSGSPSESRKIIAEFNKIYPFLKVDYWGAKGEEKAAKIEAEYAGGSHTVDVCLGGEPYNFPRWRKMGILERFSDIIPGIGKFDKRMIGKYGDSVMAYYSPKAPQYNTKLVSAAEAPKTWEDLLNPKWKGQLGIEAEANNWAYMALAEGGWGIEKMEKYLAKLIEQKPRFTRGSSASHALLVAGEFKVFVLGNIRNVLISQQEKAPVDWVRVNPIVIGASEFILPKKGPHPGAARLFLEWVLSPRGLPVVADVTQNYVPGTETPMSKLLDGMPYVVRTEEVLLKMEELGLMKKINKQFFGIED